MILKIRRTIRRLALGALLILTAAALTGCGEKSVSVSPTAPTASPAPTEEPLPVFTAGYMSSADGLFHPESPFTRQELSDILYAETGKRAEPGSGELTADVFRQMTETVFDEQQVAAAMREGISHPLGPVGRAEAVVCLNRLFSLSGEDAAGYFPDVSPEYWACRDILLACTCENPLGTADDPLPPGLLLLDCELYAVDDAGYFLKNTWNRSLYFGSDGKYTSGSPELDGYVTETFRSLGGADMDRETLLKAAYDHTRDDFTYLTRNYYKTGDSGWGIPEATTMYATGKGNCYCYAAAFWAAARALGWNAKAVSGTYGEDEAPHGWVEIYGSEDGARYTYDPEIEMKSRVAGNKNANLFAMTDAYRSPHDYREYSFSDDFVPRQILASNAA